MSDEIQCVPLRVIPKPTIGPVLDSPPTWEASNHSVHFTCGHCGSPLLRAETDQVHNLQIHCRACGTYNTTD
jgi:predicted RNA-binding Zn-ribbon protein involved in translation (DUF1610 family)